MADDMAEIFQFITMSYAIIGILFAKISILVIHFIALVAFCLLAHAWPVITLNERLRRAQSHPDRASE